MKIYSNVLELVGRTPLVRINRMARGLKPTVLAKLESFNPAGSVKDRIAVRMLDDAEKRGVLKPGGTVIEATSGNTGLGLAMVCALRGYRCICTLTDKQSQEKINLLKAYGAEVVVCPTAVLREDPRSYHSVAHRLSEEIPNAYFTDQYSNLSNPSAHYESTGPEIWEDTDGKVTAVVLGMGTGGTTTGVARYLKERNPAVRIIGVDPVGSVLRSAFETGKPSNPGQYKVEGIGQEQVPEVLDFQVVDRVISVTDKDAFLTARKLVRAEGIFAGGSSGAAMWAALQAARDLGPEDIIVALLPETGARNLSKVYSDAWMQEHQYLEPGLDLTASRIVQLKPADAPQFVCVGADASAAEAITLLKRWEISQVPVMAGADCVGSFTEDIMIDLFVNNRDTRQVRVRDVMRPAFPAVGDDATIEEISRLLTNHPAVLVRDLSGRTDVITKFDLVHSLAPKVAGG